ncbi:MAG: squalene/phytoene synthase family protein [Sinobacteraceae bacterium]|nr:squalene/phytoene synthase family protein [Nevskiaceae bacterium]
MPADPPTTTRESADEAYQDHILPDVSRTFALTIPQLPAALRTSVTSAYLLCRIADTIEDEPALIADATLVYLNRFVAVLAGREPASALARDLLPHLSQQTLAAERDLVRHMERVVRVTARLPEAQRFAIQRCVEIMCSGMHQFQQTASLRGLPRLTDLDDYCYYVAGVVGQMLTELFCSYSPAIEQRRAQLNELAVSFAQGLQMTNILKDVWEDRSRGACWLPQEVFSRRGVDLARIAPGQNSRGFDEGMHELTGVAHAHLRNALSYTLLIPARETGIRRFLLWAIGLAVLTLRKIVANPGFTSGQQVKIRRSAVAGTRISTNLALRSNWMLRQLFNAAARGLPLTPVVLARRAALSTVAPAAEYTPPLRHMGVERGIRRSEGRSAL